MALLLVGSLPCYLLARRFEQRYRKYRLTRKIQQGFCRIAQKILGIKLILTGKAVSDPPVFWVANHQSYLDTIILSSLIDGDYVAKSEIANWPILGYLARVLSTIFVDRTSRHRISEQQGQLRQRLQSGKSVILFPEGTSSDGSQVLPFKSALFSAVTGAEQVVPERVIVQPVSIILISLDGMAPNPELRSLYAWFGDMELLPHVWRLFGVREMRVAVIFDDPVSSDHFTSRRELAYHCWSRVTDCVAAGVAPAHPL